MCSGLPAISCGDLLIPQHCSLRKVLGCGMQMRPCLKRRSHSWIVLLMLAWQSWDPFFFADLRAGAVAGSGGSGKRTSRSQSTCRARIGSVSKSCLSLCLWCFVGRHASVEA
eukprot:scaffold56674_cov56-Cyclotella_meneghiniana.AAC.4